MAGDDARRLGKRQVDAQLAHHRGAHAARGREGRQRRESVVREQERRHTQDQRAHNADRRGDRRVLLKRVGQIRHAQEIAQETCPRLVGDHGRVGHAAARHLQGRVVVVKQVHGHLAVRRGHEMEVPRDAPDHRELAERVQEQGQHGQRGIQMDGGGFELIGGEQKQHRLDGGRNRRDRRRAVAVRVQADQAAHAVVQHGPGEGPGDDQEDQFQNQIRLRQEVVGDERRQNGVVLREKAEYEHQQQR